MNEEEIRGNLLLPFLADLGFNASEISLEKSFRIRLGKHQHTIRGRSDILCKRNGKNLFIFELKRDAVSLSQDDIDQGISYARALDEIAPFTIISNGNSTRIFDTVSKQELTGKKIAEVSDYWRNGCTLSMDEDLRIRYEALKNFVSLSNENLQEFCKYQVQDRMSTILGDIDSPSAKFVKGLHVQRTNLTNVFKEFIDSQAFAFGIVGKAGVGKTNALCALALESLTDHFVFFYNAAIINRSPLQNITQDLNAAFSGKSDHDTVLKKLNDLGRFINKKILLFIDAIDESVDKEIAIELSEIALAIRNLGNIKLCISCKDNIWLSIIKPNNTPTHLYEELAKFNSFTSRFEYGPGYLLEDFNDVELKEIIPIYKNAFGFKGNISEQLLKELKNGFFLRIFSEVYSEKEIPEKIDDKHLISEYLKQSLSQTTIGVQRGLRELSQVGKILLNHKYTEYEAHEDAGIEVERLLDALNYSLDQTITEDLFTRNVLARANKEDSHHVSFYYSKIRDYIICFHTCKLHQLDDRQFSEIIESLYENYIGQSAIDFYIGNASYNHRQILIEYKKSKALSYVTQYESYLEEHFANFKALFSPGTKGNIGIVFPKDVLKNDGYALYPMPVGSTERLVFENLRNAFSTNYDDSRIFQMGVDAIYGSHTSLLKRDQSSLVEEKIFEQLNDIIEKGRINPYISDILLLEQVALVVYYYRKELALDAKLNDFNLPRFELIYPIRLEDIQRRVKRFLALRFFRDKGLGQDELNFLVDQAVNNQTKIPRLRISGDFPPFEAISDIIEVLQKKGYDVIESHHLPYPDRTITETRQFCQENNFNRIDQMRAFQYSGEQAKAYIESFFKAVEKCYMEFVDHLFPTLKDNFAFYQNMPHEYFFYLKDSDGSHSGFYGYRPSDDGKIGFHFKAALTFGHQVHHEDRLDVIRGFSFERLLHRGYHSRLKTFDKLNTSKIDDFCMIRSWVYKLLKNDIGKVYKEKGFRIKMTNF